MQGQLGVDKRHPLITIQSTEDDKKLIVYLGFVDKWFIPNDTTSIQYRLYVGELAAAGFSISQLAQVFPFSRPTIMRYRSAVLNISEEAELLATLQGAHCQKTKLRPEVEAFIRRRFEKIYPENRGRYNQQLRQEIQDNFQIVLSPEAVRQVIAPLRHKLDRPTEAPATEQNQSVVMASAVPAKVVAPACLQLEAPQPVSTVEVAPIAAISKTMADAEETETGISIPTPVGKFYLHAGLLLLNFWLQSYIESFKTFGPLFLQWLYQIFAGAVNFEQAHLLSMSDLSFFIGQQVASVSQSRSRLGEFVQNFQPHLQSLYKVNIEQLRQHWEGKLHYFYIDGHFDPYHGKSSILAGWSCLFNRAMKGTQHYTIHDAQGWVVAKELQDCFHDFRVFLKQSIAKIKDFMMGAPFGIVFDRGGFSEETFQYFNAQGVCFISWEKNFDVRREKNLTFTATMSIEREINTVGHFKAFQLEYLETTYELGATVSCRKIIIHPLPTEATPPADKDFYASIITNDPFSPAALIIEFMLGRWRCQENDFKYQKKHFGLDQITSYDVLPVRSIQSEIDAHKGELAAEKLARTELQAKQSQLYTALGVRRLTQKIEKEAATQPQKSAVIVHLRNNQTQLKELNAQISQLIKKIRRLEKIEKKGYCKLDLRKKMLYDQVRFTARNIFYKAVADFRNYYTNLRNLHEVFRCLVRTSGFIRIEKEQIVVILNGFMFQGKVLNDVREFLVNFNQKNPILLDGSHRKIVFFVKTKIAN